MLLEARRLHDAVEGHELDDDQPHGAMRAARPSPVTAGGRFGLATAPRRRLRSALPLARPGLARGPQHSHLSDGMAGPCRGGDAMTTQATADLLAEVQALIREREREGVLGLAELIGPAEWADLVPQLEPNEVAVLIQWLPDEEIAEILEELPPIEAARILRTLSAPEAGQLLGEMDPDDAADVVEVLPDERGRRDPRPDEARGGGRDPRALRLRARHGRRDHDARLRGGLEGRDLGPGDRRDPAPRRRGRDGQLRLRRRRGAPPARRPVAVPAAPEPRRHARSQNLMAPSTVRVRASADQETAARLLTDRNLLAIPVVDDDDHLLGIITEDDVADVIEAEATEDIERLGGSQPLNLPYRLASVPLLVRKRVGWLLLLFIAQGYTGTVLQNFEGELAAVVALSFFIPLLIGTGGNVGSQTVTLVVRAMALGEVAMRDIGWLVFKELRVGLVMGLVMAVAAVGQAWFLGVSSDIATAVSIAVDRDLRLGRAPSPRRCR